MRESKSNTKQSHIFQLRSEVISMSRYRIPITPFEIKKEKSTTLSKWHIFVFCFIKGSKCNGPICSRKSWNQFSPYGDYTHRHTHTQKHISQDHRSGAVEKEAGWTLSWESNGAEGAEMRSWNPPLWEELQHAQAALGPRRRRGRVRGRSVTVATHAGLQSHKQHYEGIWGPSVTTDGNK